MILSRINAERLKIRLNFSCRTGHAFFVRSLLPALDLSGVMSKNRKQFKLVGVFHIVQTMKAIDFTQGNTPRTIVLTAYYFIIKQKLLPDTKK